jgi:hypothetical protein
MVSPDLPTRRTADVRPLVSQYNVVELAMAYKMSQALYTAVRLEIPDKLSESPQSSEELAAATHTDEMALYRILRALASVGVFSECEPRRFALTDAGRTLCKGPKSVRDLVLWTVDPFQCRMYSELLTSARAGTSACKDVFGKSVFEYLNEHPGVAATFDAAMTNLCELTAPLFLEAYDFSPIRILVDIGGGEGTLLIEILKRYPALRGVLCDSPRCLEVARSRLDQFGLQSRCSVEQINFFERVPDGGDAYLLKNVLHDWQDEGCIRILRNCRRAMTGAGGEKAKLLVVEAVLVPGQQKSIVTWLDLDMLALAGGKERTIVEFRELLEVTGFELARVIPTRSGLFVFEAFAA